jgi:DNA-binding beta-propeller fold protein YncE
MGLTVLPGGRSALIANHTADSISLIDLTGGKVVAEQPCGRKPVAVACSPDGRRAAVSNLWSGTVSFFEISDAGLKPAGEATVGTFPLGLAVGAKGATLFVALAGDDAVVQLDWTNRKTIYRWPAPREPREVILSPDGRWLAAASSRSGEVRCWNLATRQLHWIRRIEDGFNLRGLAFTLDGQAIICAHAVRREFPVSKENIEEGWVIDSRLTRLALRADELPAMRQLALDTRGRAVGDPCGIAISPDGRRLAVSGSGTHELLLMDLSSIPWSSGDPGDFINAELAASESRFRRIPLGGRPLAVLFPNDGERALVANYLLDAVQIVDVNAGKLLRTISLGSPEQPSLARTGEAIFYDAQRSHHQWFSCNSCHVEGHTCGLNFDTLNDDSYGNPKLTPTLRHVAKTAPWTWHGWQTDLGAAVQKSLTETMFGTKASPEEIKAVVAFLETLDHPPNPRVGPGGKMSESAHRGQLLFMGKARCARCHKGQNYTSDSNYDVKLEPDGSPYSLWNPPSLCGLFDRGPYLHDGRAKTLVELLDKHHSPEKLGGQTLTTSERSDLLEFLKSL